ncbi:MAG: hypothetical protein JW729_05750 [Bacteroidales bacterium]|nr:hypothetical protein [Bacteroidales bacterium]
MIVKTYNEFINFLSFTKPLRNLRSKINKSIDLPEIIEEFPDSHPRGFIKEFKKRRTTIVETYLKITKSIDSTSHKEHMHALKLLAEHILYARSLKMPLNAARVQLALMKQVVNNRDNKRAQLELMADFTESSFGHPRSIRKFLKKLDILEVPETGEPLRDLKMGWDFHVHDNASYGRKSPIQIVVDGFIKGISELTIAYNNLNRTDAIIEVLETGKILGIKVNIAIEFSAMTNGKQFHYMYILPEFSSKKKKFKQFLKNRSNEFDAFLYELEENQKKRHENIVNLINSFNTKHLPQINKGYQAKTIYYLKPLSIKQFDGIIANKIGSRRLLGEYLYPRLKLVLEKRALQITALRNLAIHSPDKYSTTEIEDIEKKYREIRKEYKELAPEKIRLSYFVDKDLIQAETAVSSLREIYRLAKKAGGKIKFIQPLEHGLESAINMVIDNFEFISHTEIFNMFDSIETDTRDFIHFSNFIKHLNNADDKKLNSLFNELEISVDQTKLEDVLKLSKQKQLIPSIGSDATGRSTLAPGMGFIFENRIAKHQLKSFSQKHKHLAPEISELVYEQSTAPKVSLKKNEKPRIICLGKVDAAKINELGDEKEEKPIRFIDAIGYIHPAIKNLLFILFGFLPAYYTVGFAYALLWFTITGTRNVFVDMIAGNGFKPSEWTRKDIDWSNMANSLFWTGFSVPILGFVKSSFDVYWQWEQIGAFYEFSKFFFINLANGMYLASHNYIRGFDKITIRGNFFRSILAWPLSAAFSPLGNVMLLPSIVQAKFWSDFVAAIIEGSGKYKNIIKLKDRIVKSLLPDLESDDQETEILAVLDLLYLTKESTRVKTVLQKQLIHPLNRKEQFRNIFRIKKKKAKVSQNYNNLLKWVNNKTNFDLICNYTIQHYNREQSLYLLQLLSSNYTKTFHWLKKIKP